MIRDRNIIKFNVLRNALYHTARRMHFERWNRVFNFVVVLLGATAMSDFMSRLGIGVAYAGAAIAFVGAIQLVFDFGRMARDHQQLQRDYYNLLADIEESTEPSDTDYALWHARMIRITADEPPVLRAIDAKAYNDALGAMEDIGFSPDERLYIPFLHRVFSNIIPFEGHEYLKMRERKEARKKKHTEKLGIT